MGFDYFVLFFCLDGMLECLMWLVVGDGVVWVEYIDIYVDVNLFC